MAVERISKVNDTSIKITQGEEQEEKGMDGQKEGGAGVGWRWVKEGRGEMGDIRNNVNNEFLKRKKKELKTEQSLAYPISSGFVPLQKHFLNL